MADPQISDPTASLVKFEARVNAATTLLREVVRWTGIGYCVYRASLVLMEWSGSTTVADVAVGVKATGWSGATVLIAVVFGVGGIVYGRAEARHRRRAVARLERRLERHEARIRSPGGIAPPGDTSPEEEER